MNLLVIDDEIEICNIFSKAMHGIKVLTASTGSSAIRILKEIKPEIIILDLQLPDIHGIELLKKIREIDQDVTVIVLTGFGSADSVVEAMKLGAYEFINKPFDLGEIRSILKRAMEEISHRETTSEEPSIPYDSGSIVGKNPQMLKVYKTIGRVTDSDVTVLIYGETGTGKELVASVIHSRSKRREGPFVPVDCMTLPKSLFESQLFGHEKGAFTGADSSHKGLIEAAEGGTVFIDEIGNLDSEMQAKLLRVIQEKTFSPVGSTETIDADIRIIAATNQNPESAIEKGTLRKDFYYRLNVVAIYLPPLRERKEDILLLAKYFLRIYSEKKKTFSKEVDTIFENYPWHGNVRELQNVLRRITVASPDNVITPEDLPEGFHDNNVEEKNLHFNEKVDQFRKNLILEALKGNNWNQQKTSKDLRIAIRSLRHYIKKFNLTSQKFESA